MVEFRNVLRFCRFISAIMLRIVSTKGRYSMKIRPSRAIFCLVLILMISAVLGGVFGGQVRATTKGEEDADAAVKHFTTILGLVEENYANDVDSDKAVYGAIDGMLRTLDPHSKFFDPKAFNSLREDQRGKYYGLG